MMALGLVSFGLHCVLQFLSAGLQQVQVHLPHKHGGMGLRHFNEDVGTAARLSSAALAYAALTDGNERALPFRGLAEVEARMSLNKLREAWPFINGLSNSLDEPGHVGRKAVRCCIWQRCSKASPAQMLMHVLQPSLPNSKQMQGDHRHGRRIRHSLISRASSAAQGRPRRHVSQRDQASRS